MNIVGEVGRGGRLNGVSLVLIWLLALLAGCAGNFPTTRGGREVRARSSARSAPDEYVFLCELAVQERALLRLAGQAEKQAADPRIKAFARRLLEREQERLQLLSAWRERWYPRRKQTQTNPLRHTAIPSTIPSGPGAYDRRWLGTVIAHSRGVIHLLQDYQNKLYHPEIQDLTQLMLVERQADLRKLTQLESSAAFCPPNFGVSPPPGGEAQPGPAMGLAALWFRIHR